MKNHWKNPVSFYYAANWLYRHHIPILPAVLQMLLFLFFGVSVSYRVRLGPGCQFAHGGNGIVIHSKARIGSNVYICHQVTIGGTGLGTEVPVIGDDVYIGAGAKILGAISVGSNSVIGANAVVVKSVPAGCVAAGVPAHILRENINAHDVEIWM
jgi:serine O-acetyltransferase